jgi:molybdopterin synthase catalytic subunit
VLVAPFTSLVEAARTRVGWPLCHLVLDRFDNRARLDALAAIAGRYPRLAPGGRILTARNREYVDSGALLADGDELALIPPVSGGSEVPGQRILVTAERLSVDDGIAAVRDDAHGGIVVFIGTVRERSRGQRVERLDYEAYPEMAEATMREIATRLESGGDVRVAMHHRVGELAVGDIAVVVVAGSAHRDAAFIAARAAIDELKTIVPIWKKEVGASGEHWVGMPS